jgi:hypothetical protein
MMMMMSGREKVWGDAFLLVSGDFTFVPAS